MGFSLTWKQPPAAAEREWREITLPQLRQLRWYCLKWGTLLGVPALSLVGGAAPAELPRTALAVVFLIVGIPWAFAAEAWLTYRWRASYTVSARGLRHVSLQIWGAAGGILRPAGLRTTRISRACAGSSSKRAGPPIGRRGLLTPPKWTNPVSGSFCRSSCWAGA